MTNSMMLKGQSEFIHLCESIRFAGDRSPRQKKSDATGEESAEYAARMMSQGLRVTSTLTPEIWRAVERATQRLRFNEPPKMFIVNDPVPNASAPGFGQNQEPIIIANSGLVELLSSTELEFVIGHELGHLGIGHDVSEIEGPMSSDYTTIQHMAGMRAAEISADRVGLVAVQSLTSASIVKIKLASGLSSDHVKLDVKAFLDQLQASREAKNRSWEVYATHPQLPLRLLALIMFADSDAYFKACGIGSQGRPIAEVDKEITHLLDEVGGGSLATMKEEKAKIGVAWIAAVLACEIREHKRSIKLIAKEHAGSVFLKKALNFCEEFGAESGREKLLGVMQEIDQSEELVKSRVIEFLHSLQATLNVDLRSTQLWNDIPQSIQHTKE